MDFANQPVRKRESVAQPSETVVQRRDIAGDLLGVLSRDARNLIEFKEQQI